MPDPATLALTLFNFMLPHLDYIRGKAADTAITESAKAVVGLLKDKWLSKSEAAQAAVADAAANPTDGDNQEAVKIQLRKALKADPEFAGEVARLMTAAGVQLTISGDNNKTAVVTGPGNTTIIG